MAKLNTTRGMMEEDDLLLLETRVETDDSIVIAKEYCVQGCEGPAHTTGLADAPGHFCNSHVKRDVHVTMKRWPEGMAPLIGGFGE